MKYRSTGEVAGGSRGISTQNLTYRTMNLNHRSTPVMARSEEVAKALDLAIVNMARQVFLAVPVDRRSKSDTQFLSDCIRGRRCASGDTLARLLSLAGQADTPVHSLSDAIRAVEVQMCAATPLCPTEVSDAEDDSNYPLDHAQKLYEREPTRTRAQQVVELAVQQFHKTRMLIDVFTLRAARHP